MTTAPALQVEGLHKSFGKAEVLKGIDLTLAPHDVVCLIGASGSGKSTLLRCVNLLEPLDSGRIFLGGEEITRRGADVNDVRRRIGIVFQAFNLFPHMTVLRNVTLALRDVLKLPRAEAEARALELLARFGLEERRCGNLAGTPMPRRPRCSSASDSLTSATSTPTGSPAASSSASRSSGHWRCGPS